MKLIQQIDWESLPPNTYIECLNGSIEVLEEETWIVRVIPIICTKCKYHSENELVMKCAVNPLYYEDYIEECPHFEKADSEQRGE